MNTRNIVIGLSAAAVVVLVLAWWLEHTENEKLKSLIGNKNQDIQDLEVNNLMLMQKLITADPSMSDVIKKQLYSLITKYEIKNPKIAVEISSVINLVEAQEFEKAVMSIAKIIENILKAKLHKDANFKKILVNSDTGKKRRAVFADYINYAGRIKILTKAETYFAESLREFRNEEAHEVGVRREPNYNIGSILTGVELILKCDLYTQNSVASLN